MTTVKNIPAKTYYKQKYDQYKQLLDIKLRQDVSQGSYDNVIQDYHAGCTRGELCTRYKLSYLKLKIILRDEHSFKIPSADVADIKLKLQNKSTTKKEIMGTTNYRTLLMTKNNMELLNYVSVAQISYQNILKNYLKHDLRTIPTRREVIHSQYTIWLPTGKTKSIFAEFEGRLGGNQCTLKDSSLCLIPKKFSETSATKKHIQCMFIEKEHLGFLWFEIILYKQRLIELFGSYVAKEEDRIYQGKQTSDDNLITKSSSEKEFCKLMVLQLNTH
ncbi:hypothetical protein PROFUN_16375 [Planoprotostelium fungivorum]|uniref:Uncharacterized protein n=1 Tax=Planoprotostelium fungivorum TaxID=1890364 RepID=A0A2P6MQS1_9EUKA|nr:hypothetical protein PROFUN_16375 [Planoprotostelium fungivorum]